jgi:DUF2905 family protein
MNSDSIGLVMVAAGLGIALLGVLVFVIGRVSFFGDLPGDISIKGDGYWVFIPLATSLLLSLILTIALNIFIRLR